MSKQSGPAWLAPDEHVELRTHPHWKWLIRPVLVFLLASVVLGAGLYFAVEKTQGTEQTVAVSALVVVYLVFVVLLCLARVVAWLSTTFYVTDKRVAYRHGVLTRKGIDIPISRISSVEFRHGLVDRLLRTGVLVIESASQDPLEFEDIPDVERVHAMLYREVFGLDGQRRG